MCLWRLDACLCSQTPGVGKVSPSPVCPQFAAVAPALTLPILLLQRLHCPSAPVRTEPPLSADLESA